MILWNGDIKNERDNLEEGHEVIVFYSGDLVYLITNTDGQTRVKVCEQSKLTQEDWEIIDRTLISSHILDNYATMVRLGDNTGRERLYPTSNSNNTSNTKLYLIGRLIMIYIPDVLLRQFLCLFWYYTDVDSEHGYRFLRAWKI